MKCPKCGNEDRIDIHAAVWLRLTADGTDADASNCGDHEYTPDIPACCAACDYTGSVKDFDPPDEDSEDQCLKLVITEQNDTRIILGIDHAGRQWEIDVRLEPRRRRRDRCRHSP